MKKLTVLQTLPALHSGGVERGTLEIARALVAAGHRSIVVSNGGRLVDQLVREGSEHIQMPVHRKSLASLFQIRPFRRLLRELKPDIVHARSRIPAWVAWLALRRMDPATRPRFITTVHGLYSVSPYSAIMTKGEVVIAVSETVREYILTNYPSCLPERIKLIYRGVDPEEFPFGYQPSAQWLAKWQHDYPQLFGKKILCLPGRITRLKGHEDFFQLVLALKACGEPVHGLIVGGVEDKKRGYLLELETRVTELGLQSDITFTGLRSDIRDVFSKCDLVLSLSTQSETFGRTVLEALCIGTPVVGWDQGGVGEILRECYPEGAAQSSDQKALIAMVAQALHAPPNMSPIIKFHLNVMCKETLAIYCNTLTA
ncbi:glycosyltransferase [Paraperlucidibaca sp.]|jgi:glycosyltransferase involved in cell wall biosynthesis|uniref:glycosyltransferase n=1 Tax=Paraperlucidibaca sp. TaxID=2708021 RepID=UPI003988C3C0|tara:strand:+ start:5709 stop:6821 length:1113 start_codon:yes stop_codon:yes gene_type:complete